MEVRDTDLTGVKLVIPRVFDDPRGFFLESYNQRAFADAGLPDTFVQDNHSFSTKGVLRGLHYQYPTWQGKLVRAVTGRIFDVAVDIRADSPEFGRWFATELSSENKHQLWVPPGYAHGFCVLSDYADVTYKVTTLYEPSEDRCIRWDDPDIGVQWPIAEPIVSDKDAKGELLKDLQLD